MKKFLLLVLTLFVASCATSNIKNSEFSERDPSIMAITIKIGPQAEEGKPTEEEKPVQANAFLKIRKTLDGSFIIFDHEDIDIVVMSQKNKIVTFAKDEMGDHIYAAQSRLFDYLSKKGIIEFDSIQGGNIYGSLEAKIQTSEEANSLQMAIFVIGKFIEEERPFYRRDKKYQAELERELLEPSDEDSTELGEVPHDTRKGVINRWPGSNAAYGLTGMYRA